MEWEKKRAALLLKRGVKVINFGMASFADDLRSQEVAVLQMKWAPQTAKKDLLAKLKRLKSS